MWDEDKEVEELFASGDDGPGGGRTVLPLEVLEEPSPEATSALELAPELQLSYRVDQDGDGYLWFQGLARNRRAAPTRLDELTLVARDSDGRLIDSWSECIDRPFRESLELVCEFPFEWVELSHVARFDVFASHSFEFRRLAASWRCEPFAGPLERVAFVPIAMTPVEIEAGPGEPVFEIEVVAYAQRRPWDEGRVVVVVRHEERAAVTEFDREIAIAVRDEQGTLLGKEQGYGSPIPLGRIYREEIALPLHALERVRQLDVGVKGRMERVELLRSFRLE